MKSARQTAPKARPRTKPPSHHFLSTAAENAFVLILIAAVPLAAQDTVPRPLPPVVVTRDVGRSPLDLPYAITTLRPDSLAPGQTRTLVEQTLSLIPGVTVANRNNPSQDARISIRGFGARSQFGVRSIRVMRDGMPLTLADGQTPLDYLDLESVGTVETLRGTASALYGNASGGVIDLRSVAPPSTPIAVQGRVWGGFPSSVCCRGTLRDAMLVGGTVGAASFVGNVGRTSLEGQRDYARQRQTNGFLHAASELFGTELSLVGMGLDMPLAENPGALTRAQLDSAPTMADSLATQSRARKEIHQIQFGLAGRRPLLEDGEVTAQIYSGTRSLYNPLQTGIVVGIMRHSGGASARAALPLGSGVMRHRLTVGVDLQRLNDDRQNWTNCNRIASVTANCPTPRVDQGKLQLDQREIVRSIGPYIRDEMTFGRFDVSAGVRADRTSFEVLDAFLSDGRDDSGVRVLRAVSPMVGVAMRVGGSRSVYGSVSTAFETPTTTELANLPDGSAGVNGNLGPQHATTIEVGSKGFALPWLQYDLALFTTGVRDELIQQTAPNNRSYFLNAGRTRRRGVETALGVQYGPFAVNTAFAYSDMRFVEFRTATADFAGNAIPGIPERQVQVNVTWRDHFAFAVAEWIAKSQVYVNDANSTSAPGYGIVNLRGGYTGPRRYGSLTPVLGVQNLFNRKYVGSVAINAVGTVITGKFYEPAPTRMVFVGLSAATAPW